MAEQEPELTKEEIKEALEHRDMLTDVRAILGTAHGQRFFKYLLKHFGAADLPIQGSEGVHLHEQLGHLRAGQAVFKIAAEANVDVAAHLIAEIEKERYAELLATQNITRRS